ncbi:hypothetical protein VRRI112168_03710 [Vreelandella rituensis]|nr:hypothetical protein [Halomonas rituensis]
MQTWVTIITDDYVHSETQRMENWLVGVPTDDARWVILIQPPY